MEKENNKRKIKGGVLAVILILAVCAAGFYAAVFEISNREPETLTTPATVAQKTTSAKNTTKKQSSKTTTKKGSNKSPDKNQTRPTKKKPVTTTKKKPAATTKRYTTKSHGWIGGVDNGNTIRRDPTTTKRYTTTTKKKRYDPYHAADYYDPEDFYYDHYDDFFDYYDAEDYYYDHYED